MANRKSSLNRRVAALLVGTSLLALTTSAQAVIASYTGNGSSNNWSDTGNWFGGNVPTDHADVTIQQSGGFAPTNYDLNHIYSSLTLETSGNAATLANGYTINGAAGSHFMFINGAVLVDQSANHGANKLNMNIELNGLLDVHKQSSSAGLVFNGNISGTGGIVFSNNGGLSSLIVLNGTNTYTGGTHIEAGALSVSSDANLGDSSGGITLDNGTTLLMTSGFTTGRAITLTNGGTATINTVLAANPTDEFDGVIGGGGGLIKDGGGVMVLTANNTYTGGTTISAGSLSLGSLAGGTTGMVLGAITDNGTLEFHRTDNITFGNAISGIGSVIKLENSTLILTANNSYSGATTVQAGTLQLGNGGTSGMVSGDIGLSVSTATVSFDHSNNITFGKNIVGAGNLVKQGTNTLILTGANGITGLTTISGGTLQIGNGTTATSLFGDIADNGTLAIDLNNVDANTPTIEILTGNITGNGSLQQNGTGTTMLAGTNTYSGGTTISQGTLQIGIGGSTGSITGDVVDNGTLTINLNHDGVLNTPTILTLSGDITGTGGLTKDGDSTLILTGNGNTFGGGTIINSGTLQIGNGAGNGSIGGDIVDNATLVLDMSSGLTLGGDISGTGSVINTNSTALVLSGTNTFSGGLFIDGGSVAVTQQANLGAGPVTMSGGASLILGGNATYTAAIALDAGGGQINVTAGNPAVLSGAISGPAGADFSKTGNGTLVLTGANTFDGAANVLDGVLQIGDGGNVGSLATASIVVSSTIHFDRANAYTYGGVISGNGVVGQIGSGTLTLSGANTYTGDTDIEAGTVSVSADNNLGVGGTVRMSAGTTLAVTASGTFTHAVTVTGDPTFNIASGTTTVWSGLIADGTSAGTVEVTGGGTFNPTDASNSYSGGTVVKGGSVVRISVDGALGGATGGLTLGDATSKGTLNVTANTTLASTRAVALGAGGGTVSTEPTVTFEMSQAISGTGGLTVTNGGLLVLSGVSTYTGGTTISGGNLQLGNGTSQGNLAGNIADNGTLTFDEGGDATFAGAISGTGTLTQNDGAAGTLTLTANNTYSGLTTITAGTLQIGNGGTSGAIAGNVTDNSALIFNRSDNSTYGGQIGGSGTLTKSGAGTLVLTGDSSYGGITTIQAGVLQLGNGGTTGSVAGSDVIDDAVLAFNRSNTLVFSTVIVGTGAVQQNGSGTTILTNDETYTGGTTINAGTLQLGNGGNFGSIQGNVTDNGTLAFDRSVDTPFGGVVSGSGVLSQIGTGTTILTGTNTYTGGTTITAGTLRIGNGGTTGSIVGNVADAATLAFDRSDTLTFAGTISGTGALRQDGTGTLILTANNTLSGTTTISAGTLQLGNGGTSGALAGPVVDNDTLAFDRSDSFTVAGAITGTGGVRQIGTGTTQLTGDSTYSGGTTIAAGTLSLGNGGATGSIGGNVTDNGTLTFNRSNTYLFAGAISGTGGVVQAGLGTTNLTAASTYSGTTFVNAGTLLVNGSTVNSTTTVNGSATVGGTGTTGNLNVTAGTLAPGASAGASTGTLNVHGNLTMGSNGNYVFDATSAAADLVNITGSAALNGTLTLKPTGSGFNLAQNITVLTAAGGRSGTFSAVSVVGSFGGSLLPVVSYDANHVFIIFAPSSITPLLASGASDNQKNVAGAIDFAIVHDNAAGAIAPLGGLTTAQLASTLDQMSGEDAMGIRNFGIQSMSGFMGDLLDPSIGGRGGVADGGHNVTLAANDGATRVAYNGAADDTPLHRDQSEGLTLWGTVRGGWDRSDGDAVLGAHSTTASNLAGEIGVNYSPAHNSGAIGAAVGFSSIDWKLATALGEGHAQAYEFGLYYSRKFFDNYFSTAFSYARYHVTTDRTLMLAGTNTYHASFNASDVGAKFEYGHVFRSGGDEITPFVSFQAQDFGTPDYVEVATAGSPLFALAYTSQQHFEYLGELGTSWNTTLDRSGDSFTGLHARLGWQHNFANGLSDTATFAGFSGASFTVNGASPPRDAGHLKIGLEHDFDNVSLSLNAEGIFGSATQNYGGTANMSFRW